MVSATKTYFYSKSPVWASAVQIEDNLELVDSAVYMFPCYTKVVSMDLGQTLLVLGLILLLQLLWSYWRQASRLPPGPPALPLIGHLHLLGRLPHRSMQRLSLRYGPLMHLKFGIVPVVVVSSPDMAREVLQIHDLDFADRPYLLVGEYIGYNFKNIVFALYGEHWKNTRKLCSTELFTAKRLDSFLWVRMEELSVMISCLNKASLSKRVINVRNLLSEYTFNVMTRILMSKTFFGPSGVDSDKANEFKEILEDAIQAAGAFNVGEYIPAAFRWIDWNVSRVKKMHLRLDKFLQENVDEHKLEKHSTQDFTDILLSYFKQDDIYVKSVLGDMLGGGTDTSITTLEWILAELLQNPEMLNKAQAELLSAVGPDRMVQELDFPKLEYLQAIIKEAFRLHPPLSLLVPHMSRHACKVAGYDIPKGATLFVNVYAIGRHPSVWENPTKFLPERFLSGKIMDVRGHDFELLPFGSGRRSCPGLVLGMKTIQLALSNLLHGFNWSFPDGRSSHPMEEVFGVVNWMATPLQAVVAPRLSPDAYTNYM